MTPEESARSFASKLASGHTILIPARGKSMGRRFETADFFLVQKLEKRFPMPGSILVFFQGNQWVAHRLIFWGRYRGGWRYYLKGDANSEADMGVPFDTLIGRALAVQQDGELKDLTGFRTRFGGLLLAILHLPSTLWSVLKRRIRFWRAARSRKQG